jgi:hypothetical protein
LAVAGTIIFKIDRKISLAGGQGELYVLFSAAC